MEDVRQTIISQYANSPIINQLIDFWNQDIDPAVNFAEFYDFVWNVQTAVGFGLDIWGQIVNVTRYLQVTQDNEYFGFYNAAFPDNAQVYTPFNVQPFFNGYDSTPTITVDDETYRMMILAKAYANIAYANCRNINFILTLLLGENAAFVVDGFDMTIRYVFNITINPIQYAIIYQSGIIPVPTGVKVTFDEGRLFGFDSPHIPNAAQNWPWPFGVGVFYAPQD
jgi:hypothetical protein